MWRDHIKELLNLEHMKIPNTTDCLNFGRLMSKADLHGAEMEVIKSRNPWLVGLKGICVNDTRDTFGIVCKDDKYKSKLNLYIFITYKTLGRHSFFPVILFSVIVHFKNHRYICYHSYRCDINF